MSYTRAEDAQIDNWERVGNKGWSWKSLLPYYKKSEEFQIPTHDQASHGASYTAKFHGRSGPLKVGWPTSMTNSSVFSVLNETMSELGVEYNPDANSGKMIGFTSHPDTVDRERNVREDAARAYYWPYEDRSNLKIISNTRANKIIWANTTGEAVAIGVECSTVSGVERVYASKEVILSAGSLKTPQLLELSGIGNPAILDKYNISTKIALPAVGENLQDQTNNALSWESTETLTGLASFSALISVDQLYGNNVSAVESQIDNDLTRYAKALSKKSNGAVKESNLLDALKTQRDLIFKSLVPYAEVVFAPSGQLFTCEYWPLQPFSRGSVHIQSANASQSPNIDPNYFMFEQDIDAQADVAQYIRKSFGTAPLKSIVGDELTPGLDVLPGSASSSAWNSWIKAHCKLATFDRTQEASLTISRPT
jgi:choline dehydrogenase-like flavoprotein